MRFQILDASQYPLKVENKKDTYTFYRFEHRATVGWNCREYMIFVDHISPSGGPTCHIEEITGGHLERIDDESLAYALQVFAQEQGFLDIAPPIPRRAL